MRTLPGRRGFCEFACVPLSLKATMRTLLGHCREIVESARTGAAQQYSIMAWYHRTAEHGILREKIINTRAVVAASFTPNTHADTQQLKFKRIKATRQQCRVPYREESANRKSRYFPISGDAGWAKIQIFSAHLRIASSLNDISERARSGARNWAT